MNRTLVLLRHAKSSWDDPALSDFERPLAPRGRRAAPLVAQHLAQTLEPPDLVLCSPAQRTIETWFFLAPHFSKAKVSMEYALYEASKESLLQALQALPDNVMRPLIIGHNPGLEELALSLCGNGPEKDLQRMRKKFPTTAFAEIRVPSEAWPAITPASGTLARFVRPKDLS